jgi:nucleoside-diphosphate-sugar epimerase
VKVVGVTGGSGFIGRYTVEELARRGYEVITFDHSDRRDYAWPDGVELMLGDVRDSVAVTELAAHCDGIIHLAACLGTQETIGNPRPAALTNVEGGLNFLEAVSQYDLPGVYIGVGNHWMNNTYSISKTCVERFVHMFNKERNARVNIVRPVNAYGPRQRVAPPFGPGQVRKITPAFACRALLGLPIEVYGDGQQVSDMVHVTDVAKTLVTALEQAHEGTVHDFVLETGPRVSETVLRIAELTRMHAHSINGAASEIVHLPMRPGEIPGDKVTSDVSTLERGGIDPDSFVSLDDGLLDTVKWFWDNLGKTWHDPRE